MIRRFAAAALLAVASRPGVAQQLTGTVRDSASRLPIAGAVLVLLDARGATLGRNITDASGTYRIALAPTMASVRVMRIGFRPRDAKIPAVVDGLAHLDVVLTSLPVFLEPVRVAENLRCPRRSDGAATLSLIEQARAGLLGAVVSREANPPKLVRLAFERWMDGTSARIDSQAVRIDSAEAPRSYKASRSGADFVRAGFVEESDRSQIFLAPDAETLLDEDFLTGYCFHIAAAPRDRPRQIGLAFAAADRRRDRVDVEGTLWIDTAARALRDIEFLYRGLGRQLEDLGPGGYISFRDVGNGIVLIDRWSLSLYATRLDTVGSPARGIVRMLFRGSQSGGEVARAAWPDGFSWSAPLGKLVVHGSPAGHSPPGTPLRLAGTDYRATVDATGTATFAELLPGPYALVVADPRLASIRLEIPTKVSILAARDSVIETTLAIPSAEDFVINRCVEQRAYDISHTALLVGRVTGVNGLPLGNVELSVERQDPSTREWQMTSRTYKTGGNGLFWFCSAELKRGTPLRILADVRGQKRVTVPLVLENYLSVAPVVIPVTP